MSFTPDCRILRYDLLYVSAKIDGNYRNSFEQQRNCIYRYRENLPSFSMRSGHFAVKYKKIIVENFDVEKKILFTWIKAVGRLFFFTRSMQSAKVGQKEAVRFSCNFFANFFIRGKSDFYRFSILYAVKI